MDYWKGAQATAQKLKEMGTEAEKKAGKYSQQKDTLQFNRFVQNFERSRGRKKTASKTEIMEAWLEERDRQAKLVETAVNAFKRDVLK